MLPGPDPVPFAQRDDEVFDIVNERDEVIGQATRREVHLKKLWHRAVHVWVVNRDGSVFLQKRSMAKDSAPGCWDSSCSGHLDAGEDYLAAAQRELVEEIGLHVSGAGVLQEVLRLPASELTGWEFMRVYRTESAGPFTLHPAEIDEGRWWTPNELSEAMVRTPEIFTRPFAYIWRQLTQGR